MIRRRRWRSTPDVVVASGRRWSASVNVAAKKRRSAYTFRRQVLAIGSSEDVAQHIGCWHGIRSTTPSLQTSISGRNRILRNLWWPDTVTVRRSGLDSAGDGGTSATSTESASMAGPVSAAEPHPALRHMECSGVGAPSWPPSSQAHSQAGCQASQLVDLRQTAPSRPAWHVGKSRAAVSVARTSFSRFLVE